MTLEWANVKQEKYVHHKNIEKLDFIKIKNFCLSRDTLRQWKAKPQNWRCLLQMLMCACAHTHTHTQTHMIKQSFPGCTQNSYNAIRKRNILIVMGKRPGQEMKNAKLVNK